MSIISTVLWLSYEGRHQTIFNWEWSVEQSYRQVSSQCSNLLTRKITVVGFSNVPTDVHIFFTVVQTQVFEICRQL